MLHRQVVEELQPLCVSVLDSDSESRRQLETSVAGIVERLSSNAEQLESQAYALDERRRYLLERLMRTREKILEARANEYRDIVVAGTAYSPSEAAKIVTRRIDSDSWIPGPVALGAPLPLAIGDVVTLFRTNATVPPEDEAELGFPLPAPETLLTPVDFERLVAEHARLAQSDLHLREDLWTGEPEGLEPEVLEALLQRMTSAIETLRAASPWKLAIIEAGCDGGMHRVPWDDLLAQIAATADEGARAQALLSKHGPSLPVETDLAETAEVLDEIIEHLEGGGSLNFWVLLRHPAWKRLRDEARTSDAPPQYLEHFEALRALVRLTLSRRELLARWARQVTSLGGPTPTELGWRPEVTCQQFRVQFEQCLNWHATTWMPLEHAITDAGFRWQAFLDGMPPNLAPHGALLRLSDAASALSPLLAARADLLRATRIDSTLRNLAGALALAAGKDSPRVTRSLCDAVAQPDPNAYECAFERLVELNHRRTELAHRRELLGCLEASAPGWTAAIRGRLPPHDQASPPGDPARAWLWRQLHDELDRRDQVSLDALQAEAEQLGVDLYRTTAEVIDRRAWAAQVRRTTLEQQLALQGWLQTVRRIGRGTGKRAPRLQAEARRLMSACRTAIPVWIMPLARVVESFDPRVTRFDVVVIDEVSQSDVMALAALYMARRVVIVGDHEQVSPEAVGQRLDQVQHLIDEHLQGIPNAHLYDGQMSVYDLASAAFGGTVVLREHFRCVPDIIAFSNHLSYDGRLKALRDGSLVLRKPAVVAHRVAGTASHNTVNLEEALEVASLIAAALERPEYGGDGEVPSTFGVISLVGEQQALEIDQILRLHLRATEYERRRILCGNAAQFQGDERDVMFLSMVDSPKGGPLSLRSQPLFKKRFNVAASRARDQMWVIHSISPETDLQSGDLRRRLIQHARDPRAILRAVEQGQQRTESEFERQVLQWLVSAGYRVNPQWQVGHYRIDLVVSGGGHRVALECDGDRYHPHEKLLEDMQRQAILERLGWRFIRIRGSEFFRDAEGAMARVFAQLQEMKVVPQGPDVDLAANEVHGHELRDWLIRRAAEIRREWTASDRGDVRTAPAGEDGSLESEDNAGADDLSDELSDSATLEPDDVPTAADVPEDQPVIEQLPLEPAGPVSPSPQGGLDLKAHLKEHGCKVVDKRPSGGCLWVIDDPEFRPLLPSLRARGITFEFASEPKATNRRPAWWTKWAD